MGPLEMVKPWNTKGVEGVYRFLGRVWRLFVDERTETEFEQNFTVDPSRGLEFMAGIELSQTVQERAGTPEQLKALHACIKKVTDDLEGMRFNTAISAMMVFTNDATAWEIRPAALLRDFLILLQPFAPHLAEELWSKLNRRFAPAEGQSGPDLAYQPWPKHDPKWLIEATLEIPVQVNGKLRDRITVPAEATDEEIKAAALGAEKAKPFLEGKEIKKIILVGKKLVNIAVA